VNHARVVVREEEDDLGDAPQHCSSAWANAAAAAPAAAMIGWLRQY